MLATKVGKPMPNLPVDRPLSRDNILRACEDSLRRLRTDYVDVYQLHTYDPTTPIDETLEAIDALVTSGKVRAFGCSNFPVAQFIGALAVTETSRGPRIASHQLRYNLISRDIESTTLPLCRAYGVSVLAHSPLAGGLLTNRRVALKWVLAQPGVASAVVGASRVDQIEDTVQSAFEEVTLCV